LLNKMVMSEKSSVSQAITEPRKVSLVSALFLNIFILSNQNPCTSSTLPEF